MAVYSSAPGTGDHQPQSRSGNSQNTTGVFGAASKDPVRSGGGVDVWTEGLLAIIGTPTRASRPGR